MTTECKYPKMYILVNTSLDMKKGKIAGQVGHVVEEIVSHHYENCLEDKEKMKVWKSWIENHGTKIVLKCSQSVLEEMLRDKNVESFIVKDAGRTQIPAGSLTCVGLYPTTNPPNVVKELSLL